MYRINPADSPIKSWLNHQRCWFQIQWFWWLNPLRSGYRAWCEVTWWISDVSQVIPNP
jgi:hypothetical protein